MASTSPAEKKSWLSLSNCTCTLETAGVLVLVGVAIYLLARSVFDVIFWIVFSLVLALGFAYAYYKCFCGSGGKSSGSSGEYTRLPNEL